MPDYNPINNKHNLFVKTSVNDKPMVVHFWGPWAKLLKNSSKNLRDRCAQHVCNQVAKHQQDGTVDKPAYYQVEVLREYRGQRHPPESRP